MVDNNHGSYCWSVSAILLNNSAKLGGKMLCQDN